MSRLSYNATVGLTPRVSDAAVAANPLRIQVGQRSRLQRSSAQSRSCDRLHCGKVLQRSSSADRLYSRKCIPNICPSGGSSLVCPSVVGTPRVIGAQAPAPLLNLKALAPAPAPAHDPSYKLPNHLGVETNPASQNREALASTPLALEVEAYRNCKKIRKVLADWPSSETSDIIAASFQMVEQESGRKQYFQWNRSDSQKFGIEVLRRHSIEVAEIDWPETTWYALYSAVALAPAYTDRASAVEKATRLARCIFEHLAAHIAFQPRPKEKMQGRQRSRSVERTTSAERASSPEVARYLASSWPQENFQGRQRSRSVERTSSAERTSSPVVRAVYTNEVATTDPIAARVASSRSTENLQGRQRSRSAERTSSVERTLSPEAGAVYQNEAATTKPIIARFIVSSRPDSINNSQSLPSASSTPEVTQSHISFVIPGKELGPVVRASTVIDPAPTLSPDRKGNGFRIKKLADGRNLLSPGSQAIATVQGCSPQPQPTMKETTANNARPVNQMDDTSHFLCQELSRMQQDLDRERNANQEKLLTLATMVKEMRHPSTLTSSSSSKSTTAGKDGLGLSPSYSASNYSSVTSQNENDNSGLHCKELPSAPSASTGTWFPGQRVLPRPGGFLARPPLTKWTQPDISGTSEQSGFVDSFEMAPPEMLFAQITPVEKTRPSVIHEDGDDDIAVALSGLHKSLLSLSETSFTGELSFDGSAPNQDSVQYCDTSSVLQRTPHSSRAGQD